MIKATAGLCKWACEFPGLTAFTPAEVCVRGPETMCSSVARGEGWGQAAWFLFLALPLFSCVALKKLLNLSVP